MSDIQTNIILQTTPIPCKIITERINKRRNKEKENSIKKLLENSQFTLDLRPDSKISGYLWNHFLNLETNETIPYVTIINHKNYISIFFVFNNIFKE